MPEQNLLAVAFQVSAPTFVWVLCGLILRRMGWISVNLVENISRLSFQFLLPVLLFSGTAQLSRQHFNDTDYLIAGFASILVITLASWLYAKQQSVPRQQIGIFVQAVFRGNLAIIGIALCSSAYGTTGVALAALAIALWTTLYNILAVAVLNYSLGSNHSVGTTLINIVKNPLIIGIACGGIYTLTPLPSDGLVADTGQVISAFFLPLILVCIGGAMDLGKLRSAGQLARQATFWRLVIAPTISVAIALVMGVRGEPLGVLFLLLSAPVAASSYVMTVAARGDGALAANIVMLSTLLSPLSVTCGFMILRYCDLV